MFLWVATTPSLTMVS
uniref:Uncharacterized protein n=1 Tax=Rhizophora mucronata TaxID=61149 RepID=A0A2P2P7H3_RHIMU